MWQSCNIKIIWKLNFSIHSQIWLAHNHLQSHTYCLHGYLTSGAELNHWDSLQNQKYFLWDFLQKKDLLPLLSLLSIYFIEYTLSKVFSFFSFMFMTQSQITCASPKTHLRCTWILNHKDNFPNYLFMFPFLQLPVSFFLFFFFNWSIVDLHCCVCFRHIAQWFSYTYI